MQIKAPSKVGKLKVAIKKDTKKTEVAAKVKAPEVDLFSFDAEPTPPAQTAVAATTTTFDPFGPAPTAATTSFDPFGSSAPAAPAQAASFDPFGSSAGVFSPAPPSVPQQAAFDPFSSGQFQTPAPAIPMQQQPQFQPQAVPMQQQQFQSFQQPAVPMQQQSQFQQPMMGMQQQQQQFQPPGARIALTPPVVETPTAQSAGAEFGDFESAPGTKSGPAAAASKWNDLGNLVNLGSITLNEDPKAKSSAAHTQQQSFAGLDGFTKSQQSMVRWYLSIFIYFWIRF